MKLIMESWRKFLKEGISDVVYHATSNIAAAAKIEPTQIKPGTSSGFKINEKRATKITFTPIRGD